MTRGDMAANEGDPFWTDLVAAASAVLVGLASFGIFHTIWILDVPQVFVEGLLYAAPASFALAWAYRASRRSEHLAGSRRAGVEIGFLFWTTLLPYEAAGLLFGARANPGSLADVLGVLWIAFLGLPLGAAIGWELTKKASGAAAWGIAAFALDFTMGGGIAFFGGRGRMLGLTLWLLPTWLIAGMILVRVHAFLNRRVSATR